MIDKKKLDAILEELYEADPSLRAQADSLRKLAEELLASKPEAALDAAFVARLRNELTSRASSTAKNAFMGFLTGKSSWYMAPGLAVLALAFVATVSLAPRQKQAATTGSIAMATAVDRVGAGAFGKLSAQPGTGSPVSPQIAHDSALAEGSGRAGVSGASAAPTAAPNVMLPPDAGGGGTSKMMVPIDYVPTVYKYAYKGEPISGLEPSVDVYRRSKDIVSAGAVAALKGVGAGLMDMGKLTSPSVQSFTVTENRKDGYAVSVDAAAGTISAFENSQWSYPERMCQDQACMDKYRVKEGDMPSDAEAIRIADAMLDELGVSKDGYGAPAVRDDWKSQFRLASDQSSFWFPDTVSVIYPYLIDGKTALDESGAPYGLNVNVNVTHKRGSSFWNLASRRFQASSYEAETDASRLIGIAEQGGVGGQSYALEGAKVVEIDLGTPTVSYSRVWQSDDTSGSELFAPSLVFPVMNPPQDFWQASVTVPLAKGLLEPAAMHPVPMPFIQNK